MLVGSADDAASREANLSQLGERSEGGKLIICFTDACLWEVKTCLLISHFQSQVEPFSTV